MNNIRIGIGEWCLPVYGPYACSLVPSMGLDGVQLEMSGHEKGYPLSRDIVQRGYLEVKEKFGIEYPSVAMRETDFVSMLKPKGSRERDVIDQGLRAAVDAAEALGSPSVMVSSFVESEIRSDEDVSAAVELFRELCDYAKPKGVNITTEHLFSAEEMWDFYKAVDRDNLSL